MQIQRRTSIAIAIAIVIAHTSLVVPQLAQAQTAGPSQNQPAADFITYLPTLSTNKPSQGNRGIYGTIYANGSPAKDVVVELRRINTLELAGTIFNAIPTTVASTTTDLNGSYSFIDMPLIVDYPDHKLYYAVHYTNPSDTDDTRIRNWQTRWLRSTAYNQSDAFHIGDFDIADVSLLDPGDNATITLPYIFKVNVPTLLQERNHLIVLSGTSFSYNLGIDGAGQATLSPGMLPSSVAPGEPIHWQMKLYAPNTGSDSAQYRFDATGAAFHAFSVTITNPA